MARIDWAVLCDLAFLDAHDRMCIIGIVRNFPVPSLPVELHQVMLVARLADIQPVDEVQVSIGLVTPAGRRTAPTDPEGVIVQMAGEYVLTTLRGIPLMEEGLYRFQIVLRGQPVVSIGIPVVTADRTALTVQ